LVSRRVRRNRLLWLLALVLIALLALSRMGGRGSAHAAAPPPQAPTRHAGPAAPVAHINRDNPDWHRNGKPVTFAFGGDVHFPVGTNLGNRLAANPATALGPTVTGLLSGANLSIVNLESALTDGTCPDAQPKQFLFYAPATAITAIRAAGVTLISNTNNHGEDCGPAGLQLALQAKHSSSYPILGIGQNSEEAFTPYETTIRGQRIGVIAATQVLDTNLQTAWTATATHPGLASAYEVNALISEVEKIRPAVDTLIVYLHWGTELQGCPNPVQEPLAQLLVKAGADIVVGSHAHVLLGGGYLGSAYVDYGLGNFAFYDNTPPVNASGSLVITATGRHIDGVTWRPAIIVNDLPQPLSGAAAASALARWNGARSCTDATATPGHSLATATSERSPAPPDQVARLSIDRP
jgi:poly-gamma-glutamate synthesis protein (capsule biosynthesis protein)